MLKKYFRMIKKISKNDWLSVFICLALVILAVFTIYCRRPETDWINNTILALTAFVLLWYTRETAAMKVELVKQNRLQTRPILVLEFDNNKPFLKNEGSGPALNAFVDKFEVRSNLSVGSLLGNECFEFVIPVFISTDSRQELQMYRNNPDKRTKGTLSEPDILLQPEIQVKMKIRYEDIEGSVYLSTIEIQSGMSHNISFESL